jgi:hypothetical protein
LDLPENQIRLREAIPRRIGKQYTAAKAAALPDKHFFPLYAKPYFGVIIRTGE